MDNIKFRSKKGSNQAKNTGELLRTLFEATATATGDEFFRALVRHLASSLGVRQAFVSEIAEGGMARTLAIWADDGFIDDIEYPLAGTPCQRVVQNGEICQIRENLDAHYPDEKAFRGMKPDSYLGIPLVGRSGDILGHVVAMDDKPMVEKTRDFSTFKVFAARTTAELERRRFELELRKKNDQLEKLLKELSATQSELLHSEKMAALGKLIAGVVHEINTPVGTIDSNADIISRAIDSLVEILEQSTSLSDVKKNKRFQSSVAVLKKNAPMTRAASDRISGIIASLKSFVRLDQSPLQETNLIEALEGILLLMEHEFKRRITIMKEYGKIPMITGNAAELNQVFMNLLRNAASAIESTGTIIIRTFLKEGKVNIVIEDDGIGIHPGQIKRLFEPVFTTKESRIKAGLDLFISHNIIRKHGGEIKVNSIVGKGSTFTTILPPRFQESSMSIEDDRSEVETSRCDKIN